MKIQPRKAVMDFAIAMEKKLQENDKEKGKKGWKQNKDEDDWYLHMKLLEEVAEYYGSLNRPMWSDLNLIQEFICAIGTAKNSTCGHSKTAKKKELADIGNMAMMLYDNTK
jgi:predicted house-cleaning noncanonical NTP pyrophosphatase (MazG superfamily)